MPSHRKYTVASRSPITCTQRETGKVQKVAKSILNSHPGVPLIEFKAMNAPIRHSVDVDKKKKTSPGWHKMLLSNMVDIRCSYLLSVPHNSATFCARVSRHFTPAKIRNIFLANDATLAHLDASVRRQVVVCAVRWVSSLLHANIATRTSGRGEAKRVRNELGLHRAYW